MPRILTIVLFVTGLLVATDAAARTGPLARAKRTEPVWAVEDGVRYRVAFPLHSRIVVDSGAHFTPTAAGGALTLGAAWRFALDADFPDEEIWWQLRHSALNVAWAPGGQRLRLSLLEADYLRHDTSAYVLIPAKRDIRLPAPFDIVVAWKLGAADFAWDADGGSVSRWDIGELRILADLIRDHRYRHRLALGFMAEYRLTPADPAWVHDVVPLSGGAVLYGWENALGTFAVRLDARGVYGASFEVGGEPEWSWRSSGHADFEWVPFAVNDLPVALFADAGWQRDWESGSQNEWTARIGARLSIPLGE